MSQKTARRRRDAEAEPKADAMRRWLIGATVVVAVGVLLVIKMAPWDKEQVPPEVQAMELPTVEVAVTEAPVSMGPEAPPTAQAAALTAQPAANGYPRVPEAQIDWAIANHRPAMILFHSTSCIPCKAMEKLVAQVRGDYEPELLFIDVITDDRANINLLRKVGIRSIPTTYFLAASGEAKRFIGAMKEDALRAELDALKGSQ